MINLIEGNKLTGNCALVFAVRSPAPGKYGRPRDCGAHKADLMCWWEQSRTDATRQEEEKNDRGSD